MSIPETERLLADFLSRHREQLLRHARQVVHPTQRIDPEDVVQAASLDFFRYVRKRQQAFEDQGLLALARQCVETARNDQLRWQFAQKRRADLLARPQLDSSMAPPASATGPGTAAARNESRELRRQALHRVMQQLAPVDRHILQLRIDDEAYYTFARIAAVVGKSEDAVRMRYKRAIDAMKPQLEELLDDDSVLGG